MHFSKDHLLQAIVHIEINVNITNVSKCFESLYYGFISDLQVSRVVPMRMSNSNVKLFGFCIKQVTETVTIDIQHFELYDQLF